MAKGEQYQDHLEREIARLCAERDKWMEYATGDRAELALKMEALRAELATKERELGTWQHENGRRSAELDNARLERDNIAALNSSLIAELAAKEAAHAETRGLVRDLTACLENRNRELAEAKARIAELENKNSYNLQIVREAMARAEAELKAGRKALSFYADEKNWHTRPHCYSVAVLDCGTKARAALASSPDRREG